MSKKKAQVRIIGTITIGEAIAAIQAQAGAQQLLQMHTA